MKSSDLDHFSSWQKWTADVVSRAPNLPGVYAFRIAGVSFGRIKGESDLVYIGCTEAPKRTVRERLRNHLVDRNDKEDIGHRLHRVRREIAELDVAWKTFNDAYEAQNCERQLLAKYENDHVEFPPLNRKESGKRMRKAEEALQQLSPDERARVIETLRRRT